LIRLASGFEAATQVRAKNLPTFAAMLPSNNIQGTTPTAPHGHGPLVPMVPGDPSRRHMHAL
jgi:hypothetical protein